MANTDMELACNEAVIKKIGFREKKNYAYALVQMAATSAQLYPLCSEFSRNVLEERIVSIMKIRKTSVATLALSSTLLLGCITVFATDAPPAPAPIAQTQQNENSDYDEETLRMAELIMTADYEPFGLVYNPEEDYYAYNGKRVRSFEDNVLIDPFGGRMYSAAFADGKPVGEDYVFTRRNADGDLVGLEVIGKGDSLYDYYGLVSEISYYSRVIYAGLADNATESDRDQLIKENANILFADYESFGLEYNPEDGRLYYNGARIAKFIDEQRALSGRRINIGNLQIVYTGYQDGDISVEAMRDLNDNVTGLKITNL